MRFFGGCVLLGHLVFGGVNSKFQALALGIIVLSEALKKGRSETQTVSPSLLVIALLY